MRMKIWQRFIWGIIIPIFLRLPIHAAESFHRKRINQRNNHMSTSRTVIGGGAINEKSRDFDANHTTTKAQDESLTSTATSKGFQPHLYKAHLWHALEGFDRYPNYFQRWNNKRRTDHHSVDNQTDNHDDDLIQLEQALRETADSVRRERERIVQQRNRWQAQIPEFLHQYPQFRKFWKETPYGEEDWNSWCDTILHPTLQKLLFTTNTSSSRASNSTVANSYQLKACPQATVSKIFSGAVTVEWNVSLLTELIDEECPDVYSMPVFSPAFCQELLQLIRALRLYFAQDQPLSLSELGVTWLDDFLFRVLVQPISLHLFGKDTRLDWYHSFVAGYASQPNCVTPRQFLVPHTDDSEVTLNVCLGEEHFQGGLLEFGPMRGQSTTRRREQTEAVESRIGYGLLHVGRLVHQVTPITSGERFAYIVWTRSWEGTRAKQCPCCWLNHRTDPAACVCGPQWN